MDETKHGAMIAHLGRLARQDRSRLLGSAPDVDSEISKADREALQELESGLSMPDPLARSRVEQSLRWREGSLTEALNKTTDEVTPDWLRDWAQDEPALLASDFSDEALLSEVINRLGRWRARS